MDNFLFWRAWPKSYALIFKIILGLVVFLAVASLILHGVGMELTYDWKILNRIQTVRLPLEHIEIGLINYAIEGVNFLNIQEFEGSGVKIHPIVSVFFTVIFLAGVSLALVSATYLSRFWYYAAMAVFIFLVVLFRLENLELFGTPDKTGLIVTLVLFLAPTYYFHAFKPNAAFGLRILVMLIAALAFISLVLFFSPLPYPLLAFAGFGLIPAILLSVVFIFMVAHDVVSFFLYVITNNNNELSKNSSIHFVVITLAYLIVLLFAYLYSIRIIDWQLVYINPFIILLFSAVWGLWEFRHRRVNYENIIPFNPYGAFFYIAMAIICFATLGYFFATANDPAIETFEDVVLFSHLGFGLAFFIYVLANFFTILHDNRKVYRAVYKPTRMPYFTARLAGLIAALAFFFQSSKISYYQARAGIYNAMGDYYTFTGDERLTKEYYELGSIYGYSNHRSNYSLGTIYRKEGDASNAAYYFDRATQKRPTPYAYVNLSAVYNETGNFFQSLFALQDGIRKFEGNGPIANNLAMRYNKTNVYDSILYYAGIAETSSIAHEAATANLLGFYAQKNLDLSADTLQNLFHEHTGVISRTHLLLLMNERNLRPNLSPPSFLMHDTVLSVNQYAYLQNFLANQLGSIDTAVNLDPIVNNSGPFFEEALTTAQALNAYQTADVVQALTLLQRLQSLFPERESYYAKLMAAIALDQHAPKIALDYLDNVEKDSVHRTLTAFARLLSGSTDAMKEDALENNAFVRQVNLATAIPDPSKALTQNDTVKFNYLILHAHRLRNDEVKAVVSAITNPEIRVSALKTLATLSLESAKPEQAQTYLNSLESLKESGDDLAEFLQLAKMEIACQRKNYDSLFSLLKQYENTNGTKPDNLRLLLYQALNDEQNGRQDAAALKYESLAARNPFFEEGILEASRFFKTSVNDDAQAYNILLEALNYNPYSPRLLKAYIISAAEIGLTHYAEDALGRLQQEAEAEEFIRFRAQYDSLIQRVSPAW